VPTINIIPQGTVNGPEAPTVVWTNAVNGVTQYPDDNTAQSYLNPGSGDTTSLRSYAWVDGNTNQPVDWTTKLITNVGVYIVGTQYSIPGGLTWLDITMANESAWQTQFVNIWNNKIALAGPGVNVFVASSVVGPPGFYGAWGDNVRDWILAGQLLGSIIHHFDSSDYGYGSSNMNIDQMFVSVDYNDITPPTRYGFITEV
jgi:hypothetical protein